MTLKIKSKGNLKKAISDFKKASGLVVDVGIVKPETKIKNGKKVALSVVYATQEQYPAQPGQRNSRNVPARPTLAPGVKKAKYKPRVKNFAGNILAGNGYQSGLNKIGEVASLRVKAAIQGIKQPPLSPRTIAQRVNKGTTNPLVDTGQLKRAINYKINRK